MNIAKLTSMHNAVCAEKATAELDRMIDLHKKSLGSAEARLINYLITAASADNFVPQYLGSSGSIACEIVTQKAAIAYLEEFKKSLE